MLRERSFCFYCLALATLLALANSVSAQRPPVPRPGAGASAGKFKVGEKVEDWSRGIYYPGKVTKIDSFSGWIDVEFTADGQPRTTSHAPTGDWGRKIAGGDLAVGKDAVPAKEYPVRTWTDSTGKFKIEASY